MRQVALDANGTLFVSVYNLSKGVIIEATVRLPPPSLGTSPATQSAPAAWPGVLVEMESAGGLCTALVVGPDGNVTAGEMLPGGTAFASKKLVQRDAVFPPSQPVRLRVLVRRSMIEAYVNGILWQVYRASKRISGRLGVTSGALVSNVTLWQMLLPGEAPPPPLPPPPLPPPAPPPTAGDLCLGRTTTCSSVYTGAPQYQCSKATDGDYSTRWSSGLPYNGSAQWVAVDMGAAVTVNSAFLAWEKAYARGFALQVSSSLADLPAGAAATDDRAWTSFHVVTNGTGGLQNITGIGPVTGRYFRLLCTERYTGSPFGFSLFEFELFHHVPTAPGRDNVGGLRATP